MSWCLKSFSISSVSSVVRISASVVVVMVMVLGVVVCVGNVSGVREWVLEVRDLMIMRTAEIWGCWSFWKEEKKRGFGIRSFRRVE